MRILSWNCRGVGSPEFFQVQSDMIKYYRPDVLVLVEPKVSGAQANRIFRKFLF